MKYPIISLLVSLFVIITAFSWAAELPDAVDYFTDNGYGSPVKTMQHPSGEYYKGVTYVAYQGPLEDPYVASYHHETRKWTGPYKAGVSVLGKNAKAKLDNHGKPAMIIDDAGYIHLVFGGHGGLESHGENPLGNTHLGRMIHVVSKEPLDISSWKVLDNIPPFGTYNQFVKMENGDIYLFYRHGGHKSNWVYQISTDNGRTFASPVSILKTKRRTDVEAHDAWYAWFSRAQDNKIIAGYNYHLCKKEAHDGERHNCYYMVMDARDHTWRNVRGEKLTVPLTKEYADTMTQVVDTGDLWTARGTAALDSKGFPHVTLQVGEHMGLKGPKQMTHYRWTGHKWTKGERLGPPEADGDIRVSSPGNVSLLLAYKNDDKTGEVAWWTSADGDQRFKKGKVLIHGKKTRFAITSIIRNAHPDAIVVVAGKKGGSDFTKMYLLGDNGACQRAKADADQLSASQKTASKRTKQK